MAHRGEIRADRDDTYLATLAQKSFTYFEHHQTRQHGLTLDSSEPGSPVSVAAVGFALSSYIVAVERGLMKRARALSRSLAVTRFFDRADRHGDIDGVGHRGFFFHFLEASSGRRAGGCELSTIDTALLVLGMLSSAEYFSGSGAEERELRERVASIHSRVDWRWSQNGGDAVSLGWTPEQGFKRQRWHGYNEALLLYVLALGAPTLHIPRAGYDEWTSTFVWRRIYEHDLLYAGPLFIHQFPHCWIDLRSIEDAFMRARKTDYFENSRRATYVQHEYAIRNPRGFVGYDETGWGFTAGNGPGERSRKVRGRERRFHGYRARGAPFGPDDGTIAPWAQIASLPFAPELVVPSLRRLEDRIGHSPQGFGFHASYNPSFTTGPQKRPWVSHTHYAINQGAIVLMIENYRSGLLWRLMRHCPTIRRGLERAGFRGGWLASKKTAARATKEERP